LEATTVLKIRGCLELRRRIEKSYYWIIGSKEEEKKGIRNRV